MLIDLDVELARRMEAEVDLISRRVLGLTALSPSGAGAPP
jgi:hypothetical protein